MVEQPILKELKIFFRKHKPKTLGDALEIVHNWERQEQFDLLEKEIPESIRSLFMVDLLWLISTHGPQSNVSEVFK